MIEFQLHHLTVFHNLTRPFSIPSAIQSISLSDPLSDQPTITIH